MLPLLAHPNVVRMVGEGASPDGRPFLALELLSSVLSAKLPRPAISIFGGPVDADECTIFARRRAKRRWPLLRALACGLQLARALRYCHGEALPGARILHRDLKPDNIGFLPSGPRESPPPHRHPTGDAAATRRCVAMAGSRGATALQRPLPARACAA